MGLEEKDFSEKKNSKDVDIDSELMNQALGLLGQSIGDKDGSSSIKKELPPDFNKLCINTLPRDGSPSKPGNPDEINKCISVIKPGKPEPSEIYACINVIKPGKPEPGEIYACINVIKPGDEHFKCSAPIKPGYPGEIHACSAPVKPGDRLPHPPKPGDIYACSHPVKPGETKPGRPPHCPPDGTYACSAPIKPGKPAPGEIYACSAPVKPGHWPKPGDGGKRQATDAPGIPSSPDSAADAPVRGETKHWRSK